MKTNQIFFTVALVLPLIGCGPANEYAGHYTGKATMASAPTPKGVVDVKLDVDAAGNYNLSIFGPGMTPINESGTLRGCMLMPKGKIWMSKVKSLGVVPGGLGYTLRSADDEFQAGLGPKKI